MKIIHCKLNHLTNPLGYDLENPTVSFVVAEAKGRFRKWARVRVARDGAMTDCVYDSGARGDIAGTAFRLPVALEPMTRYYWTVEVEDDAGDSAVSEVQWFETAKTVAGAGGAWRAEWITPDADKTVQAAVFTDFDVDRPVLRARAYALGLGVYELLLNGEKVGQECLLPGLHAYDSWLQYQTFELDLAPGKNRLELVLGDGWYKGNFGLRQRSENYGDRLAAIAEIHIWYADGGEAVLGTDATWRARKSRVVESGIYCGEVYDAALDIAESFGVRPIDLGYDRLTPRLSPPITVHERIAPAAVVRTPAGETVLDMGQNMVGWLQFRCDAPKGARIHLQFGEILQNGCFYNDNLRTAKAEFTYISDGCERLVRQHFTFYGFRYVKVEGWARALRPEDFTGLVIHSRMDRRGALSTSNEMVNQLIHNALWGMKGNFLDVPTDCPQRDERYGWTGDAQIFSGTASFFMDTAAFYAKYGRDLYLEQQKLDGSVPDVVPVANFPGDASTAWADAATIIPWNVYLHSGDPDILRRQYVSMKGWVDYMKRQDDADGGRRLWQTGTHYADWLALDGNYPGGVYGGTDPHFIATGYYYHSTRIVAKAARVLGNEADAAYYGKLADEIREAFRREYFTPSGRLAMDTMTGHVVALYMGLVPDDALEKTRRGLMNRLQKNFYHLETGFVGTPYLCRTLSENGMNDQAYHLLLEEGYPGWLYEVKMGATTVWERWNSVEPDGSMSGTEMNSLNHYSYGSIVEWMFRDMCGIHPDEIGAGFRRFRLAPKPNYQIGSATARLDSASGRIESAWAIEDGRLRFRFVVPFDARAEIILPDADAAAIRAQFDGEVRQAGRDVTLTAGPGEHAFEYAPTTPYRRTYSLDTPWAELKADPRAFEVVAREFPIVRGRIPFEKELCTLREMTWGPFTSMTQAQRENIDRLLREL